jgi:hypothetical protein
MARFKPTPELIEGILARIPEGFIHKSRLGERVKIEDQSVVNLNKAIRIGIVAREGELFYDTTRLTLDQMLEFSVWAKPGFPNMNKQGDLLDAPINERMEARERRLRHEAAFQVIIEKLTKAGGCASHGELAQSSEEAAALHSLLQAGILKQSDGLVFDPLRLSTKSVREIYRRDKILPLRDELIALLRANTGETTPHAELVEKYGRKTLDDLLSSGGFSLFQVTSKMPPHKSYTWVRLKDGDQQAAQKAAVEVIQRREQQAWEAALQASGSLVRPDMRDGKTPRMQILARSYTISPAAKRIGVRQQTLEQAIGEGQIATFTDPEGKTRIAAEVVEAFANDPEKTEQIATFETLTAKEISLVSGLSYQTIRRRLEKEGFSLTDPYWGQVRGKWKMPTTLREFRLVLKAKYVEIQAEREALRAEEQRLIEEERQRREMLRAKLVAAFPTWQHERRSEQRIWLHIGPPNSGKTHEALNALAEAGSGWYLAPLRLLAFEIFDRLNQRGILCNLLTGEEYVPIPGAMITAATIEMFNPVDSGECVIIDEAQMLADPDRGWAWTRAMMEAEAPEIHVIGPTTARGLIEQLAGGAAIPVTLVEHQRLAPIRVAEKSWPLAQLPERTILVAFSRQMVLHLKTELEYAKRRVSVVYGNLPPEVRRKQADRFANGETDICVATDAVGMGLNLPADAVCFYETQKYDGKRIRYLTSSEVQQIGGRAGRFGLSQGGEVGATNKQDLSMIRKLFHAEPLNLTRARVAPTVQDLEILPGNLAERLAQWASLQSIPDSLRDAIETADMKERVELASLLTDQQVNQLGMAAALKLVNAPTRQSSRTYWLNCAHAVLAETPMPLPPSAPNEITTSDALEKTETSISCADIYLWLSRRQEFGIFAPHQLEVRDMRAEWSLQIDEALVQKLDTARRCSQCSRPLPLNHRFSLCNRCYNLRYNYYEEDEFDYR